MGVEAGQDFRLEAQQWLEQNWTAGQWPSAAYSAEGVRAHREWDQRLFDGRYSVLRWPERFGGRLADLQTETIFLEEYARIGAPERLNKVAIGMVGPTLLEFGTAEQQDRWLRSIANGADIWCQGFSEPEAGSDLTAIRTSAIVDGDSLVINGLKIWTTLAPIASWMFALVRTSAGAVARDGITFVMIPMDAEGLEVAPIRQLHGEAHFASVFLTDVRVPLHNVVGQIDGGWKVARKTLSFERASALASHVALSRDVRKLVDLAGRSGADRRSWTRDAVAEAFAISEAFRAHTVTCQMNPERDASSITKLVWSEARRQTYDVMLECSGGFAGAYPVPVSERDYWHSRAAEIFGGTNEVQRNIIARRFLDLPAEGRG